MCLHIFPKAKCLHLLYKNCRTTKLFICFIFNKGIQVPLKNVKKCRITVKCLTLFLNRAQLNWCPYCKASLTFLLRRLRRTWLMYSQKIEAWRPPSPLYKKMFTCKEQITFCVYWCSIKLCMKRTAKLDALHIYMLINSSGQDLYVRAEFCHRM